TRFSRDWSSDVCSSDLDAPTSRSPRGCVIRSTSPNGGTMGTITTRYGTELYYKDWGEGPVVKFSHGWPLDSDAWDPQMLFLAQRSEERRVGNTCSSGWT